MNLKNGYKTLYDVVEGSERVFYASKDGVTKEEVARYAMNSFKAVYQDKDYMVYGIDAEGNKVYLDDINALLVETEEDSTEGTEEPETTDTTTENTEVPNENPDENLDDEEIPEEGSEEV